MDLWPTDIEKPSNVKSPLFICREQAALLSSKTNNIIGAEVNQIDFPVPADFTYGFFIVSNSLNYRYKLFSIAHDISLYPVKIFCDRDIISEIRKNKTIFDYETIENEEDFISFLRGILNSQKTKRVIGNLLRIAKPE